MNAERNVNKFWKIVYEIQTVKKSGSNENEFIIILIITT